ncbi:aldo/keto reductase [Streptomyces sp. NPDC051976]|uniref:aldo/keto reductase n=1 Tax=Streptomyces sp. NPDC051976 TaxID=3154947 RepID=UPI00341E7B6E
MRRVCLGRSKAHVTELAFGAAGIGNLFQPIADTEAAAAVAAAWEGGIRAFDTAPHYGLGLSERRLGAALKDRPRDEFTVSTKVGRLLEPLPEIEGDDLANGFAVAATHRRVWDFSADGVRRSLEDSLNRLGLDRVDTVFLHDPEQHAEQALTEAYPALEAMRAEGIIDAIGVGVNTTELPTRFVWETDIDVVLLAGRYTLLDQSGLDELLPAAAARKVSVMAAGVFNSGLLADPRPGATFEYAAASRPLLEQALRLQARCGLYGVPLRAAAARFPLAHPAVVGVILGMRSAAEASDAAEHWRRPIPYGMWEELRAAGLIPRLVPVPEERAGG